MSAKRTDMHRLQELVRLHRMGTGARAVAKALHMGPNTERAYRRALREAGLLDGDPDDLPDIEILKAAVIKAIPPNPPQQQISTAEPYRQQITEMIDHGANAKAIHDYLRLHQPDFAVSYDAIKRFCRTLRKKRGVSPNEVAIPVVTRPGHIAQVDFGYVGKIRDPATGQHRKAWVFVMVLGHSRHLFAKISFDQRIETWIRLHVDAFAFFGAVPEVIVPDNLKAAVIRAAFGVDDVPSITRSYRELARHYGFKVDPAPPRSPQKKGKVESGVKYVKKNFMTAWNPGDIDTANTQLAQWCVEVAGARTHGATGKAPHVVYLAEEKAAMLPLPAERFQLVVWKQVTVQRDSHVSFERRLYSVPWRWMGKTVWMRVCGDSIDIYGDDERLATHSRRGTARYSTVDNHLPDYRVDYRHRDPEVWRQRAAQIDPAVATYINDVFDLDDVVDHIRRVIAMVRLLESVPASRAIGAVRRARHFGNYTVRGLRRILDDGLETLPLPGASSSCGALPAPQFARDPKIFAHLGGSDEYH
jgi:transposase